MAQNIRYIVEREGRYYFRRRVPEGLRKGAGCCEWKLSLGKSGGPKSQLLLEIRALTEATEGAIHQLQRGGSVSQNLLNEALLDLYPERNPISQLTVKEASGAYLEFRGESVLSKPEDAAVSQFIEYAGEKPLAQITRSQVRGWIKWLRSSRSQSDATIARRLSSLSAITNFVIDEHDGGFSNPFARHRLPNAGRGQRLPFKQSHFEQIEEWLATKRAARSTGLIIRMLRATGARPLEIGGLDASDINLDAEIPHMLIRVNRWRRLKTRSSQRELPLLGDGLEAATLALETNGSGALFPPTAHLTGSLSARLNKALRASGIQRSNQFTAYSFRHSMAEALRLGEVPFDIQKAILGHAKTTITEKYGSPKVELERLSQGMMRAHSKIYAVNKNPELRNFSYE